jgi:hypothetical protein
VRSLKRVRPLEFIEESVLFSLVDAEERDVSPLIEESVDLRLWSLLSDALHLSELDPRFALPEASVPLEL